ncbi:MAG TPA: MFS transporter [Pseudonocardiaceae bacterium]|nr:MFS transporter [Pseudonocardiaceae bacterium]
MATAGERADQRRPARFRDAFVVREFRTVWTAYVLSVCGDQLAAVALSVLVFSRTGSPAWAALTYALTFLPDLLGGPLLAGLADRYPRRTIMITADVSRAVLVGLMAIPHQSLAVLVVLLFVVQLLSSPFTAARGAVVPALLTGDRYVAGMTIMRMTYQLGSVAGFAVGGAVLAGLGTSRALLVDALTFVASALLVTFGVGPHRPAGAAPDQRPSWWSTLSGGWRLVMHDRRLRSLIGLACVSGAYIAPEGLAVAYAAQLHGNSAAVGILMAANPAGMVLGMIVLQRLRPSLRLTLFGPLAVATCAVLIPTAWTPGFVLAVSLWFVSGAGSAYNMITQATFMQNVPDHRRGQALGLAQTSLRVAQGVGIVGAGLLAQVFAPGTVVGTLGAAGVVFAVLAANAWTRANQS